MAKSKSARKRERARNRAASGAAHTSSGSARTSSGPARTSSGPARTSSGPARPASQRGGQGGASEKTRYRETSGRDRRRSLLYIVLFVGSIIVAFAVIEPRRGLFPALLLVLASVWVLVAWHNRSYAYRCANCRRVFRVPTIVNFLTFQGISRRPDGTYRGWKSLTCPHCHQRTRATVVRKEELGGKARRGSPGSDAQLLQ